MSSTGPAPAAGDSAAASVFVALDVKTAFEVFTQEIDLWWRHGPRFRIAGKRPGALGFEPGLGGRLYETFEHESGPKRFDVGTITLWEPPSRLCFEWRGINFKPGEKTLVEVWFTPQREGTVVRVRHSGFSSLPEGHPVRHGQTSADFSRSMGLWWGDLMSSLRVHAEQRA